MGQGFKNWEGKAKNDQKQEKFDTAWKTCGIDKDIKPLF